MVVIACRVCRQVTRLAEPDQPPLVDIQDPFRVLAALQSLELAALVCPGCGSELVDELVPNDAA